jgi:transcriptional regulator with XRE-family HTH domain
MTQVAFAKAVGLSRTSITNIESGRQPVSLHTLYSMADILGLEVGDLLPPSSKNAVALALTGEPESKLTAEEKEQLGKLSAKETNWLQRISKPMPKKKRS